MFNYSELQLASFGAQIPLGASHDQLGVCGPYPDMAFGAKHLFSVSPLAQPIACEG
jgi:hypothetical protein